MLQLEHQFTKEILPVINIDKVVVADAPDTLHIPHTAVVDSEEECTNTLQPVPQSELATVAFHFGEYLFNVLIIPLWYRKPVSLFIRSILQLETSSVAMDV